MWWNLAERAAGKLLDVGFNQLTKPKKSLDDRIEELDHTLEALGEQGEDEGVEPAGGLPVSPQPAPAEAERRVRYCLSCVQDHLAAAHALLNEAHRLMRGEGAVTDAVRERISGAHEELLAMERQDLTADTVAAASPRVKAVLDRVALEARRFKERLRGLGLLSGRITLGGLETAAAEAGWLSLAFNRDLEALAGEGQPVKPLPPEELSRIKELAKKRAVEIIDGL